MECNPYGKQLAIITNVVNLRVYGPKMFVGNGHDRSWIDAVTAMLYKIRIEYNIHRFEPEHS